MSRRLGRELEREPHHVYVHTNRKGEVIYVGRTVDPEGRPTDRHERPWMSRESAEITVSPAMPFEAAAWVEAELIHHLNPKHNQRAGQTKVTRDWRIDRICEAEQVTRTTAKFVLPYFPKDADEFEAFLAMRVRAQVERGELPPECLERLAPVRKSA